MGGGRGEREQPLGSLCHTHTTHTHVCASSFATQFLLVNIRFVAANMPSLIAKLTSLLIMCVFPQPLEDLQSTGGSYKTTAGSSRGGARGVTRSFSTSSGSADEHRYVCADDFFFRFLLYIFIPLIPPFNLGMWLGRVSA